MGATADWRTQLQPDSRHRILTLIMETLERQIPISGPEGLAELKKIAVRFEEDMFAAATSQLDYLQKISMKMLTMEKKSQTNGVASSVPLNYGGGSQNPQDPASQVRQQLFPQNIQSCIGDSEIQASVALSSALPSGAITQFSMPNAVNQGSNMQSEMAQNFSGNLVGQGGAASNMFANSTRKTQRRQLPLQQSQSSQKILYQQQRVLKQKQRQQLQGNIPSCIMQSHMQQQQLNPIQSTQSESTLQLHMQMSFGLHPCQSTLQQTQPSLMQSSSGLQENPQSTFAQSTPNVQQHPQSVLWQPEQQAMHQQAPVLHQQPHPVLPSQQHTQQLINASNLHYNQIIGKQNDVPGMQQRQQGGLLNQQTNVANMQQHLLGNSIPHHQQLLRQSNMSGLQKQQQQPMHTMHQQGGKLQQQQNAQVSPNMLQIQGQHAQSQPAQQLMSQHPSQTTQMHQQLGLQQQPKSFQRDMQQRIQTSGGSILNHQSLLDQKQVFHSQTPPPEASSIYLLASIDAAMTGNATATGTAIDVQEEVYERIKSMREKYLPDLSDMHRKISQILQQYDSLPQPPKSEGIELLKNFKIVVDRMMGFLNLPKSNVIPKDKLDSYEKQILNILTLHPPRKPGPLQQQIQPTGGHPLSIQQQQRQQQHQLPSSTSIDAVITGNATATGSLVGVQEEVYQTIKSLREKYLPDLSDMHRKISQICQQYDSLPQPPKSEEIELLKNFKIVVDKVIGFLNIPKSNVMPSMKDKLDSYEKKILDILTLNRPREPGPPQQQIQPTGGHPLSIQQQQRQQQHQMPSSTSIDTEVTRNATATANRKSG